MGGYESSTENLLSGDFSIKVLDWKIKASEDAKSSDLISRGMTLSKLFVSELPVLILDEKPFAF